MIARKHLFIAIPAVVLLAVAYALYAGYDKLRQQRVVLGLVADSTVQLRHALTNPPPPALVQHLEANLQAARAPRDPQLAAAAEQYLHTAREIVRRRAATEALAQEAAQGRQALAAHLARASSRNSSWIHQATELRKKVDDVHFDLGRALKALDELLRDLPQAAQGLPPDTVIEPAAVQQARTRAQADAARAVAELAKARQLPGA